MKPKRLREQYLNKIQTDLTAHQMTTVTVLVNGLSHTNSRISSMNERIVRNKTTTDSRIAIKSHTRFPVSN